MLLTQFTLSTSQWTQQIRSIWHSGQRHFFDLPSGRCWLDAAGESNPCSYSSLSEQEYFKCYEVPTAVSEGWRRDDMEPRNVLAVSHGNNSRPYSVSRAVRWNISVIKELGLPSKSSCTQGLSFCWLRVKDKRKLGLIKTHLKHWKFVCCLPQL